MKAYLQCGEILWYLLPDPEPSAAAAAASLHPACPAHQVSLSSHGATAYSRLAFALHSPAHSFKRFQNNQTRTQEQTTNHLTEGLSQTSSPDMPRLLQIQL